MIKYKYNKKTNKFIENGHTMFEEDVLKRLKRLSYLEEQLKNSKAKESTSKKNSLLNDGFISVTKREKPQLGSKVLVKIVYKSGMVDYEVAIYAISGYDKRKKGFFQNLENRLQDGDIMDVYAREYTRNVKAWYPLVSE